MDERGHTLDDDARRRAAQRPGLLSSRQLVRMRGVGARLAAALAALALGAAPAAAAAVPTLVVSGSSVDLGGRGTTAIELDAASGRALAGLTLYVPPGYAARLGQVPGTAVGEASATLEAGGAVAEVEGAALAQDPAAAPCGSGPHEAVWLLDLGAFGLPVAVDAVGGEPDGAFASYRLEVCLPAGLALRRLELELDGVLVNPGGAGAYPFRAVVTPAGAAAAVEARSTVLLPVRLDLRAVYDRRGRAAVLTGRLAAGGRPVAGQRVELLAGPGPGSLRLVGAVTTGSAGRFEARRSISASTSFRATASLPARDVTPAGCDAPIAPGGCVSATAGPFEAGSALVRVAVPRLPTLRLGARGADVRRLQRELVRLRYLPPGGVNGLYGERTWHAVVGFQGWQGLPRDGVVSSRTWTALGRASAPRPWRGLARGVEIDLARQVLLLVDGARTVRAIHVSTGAGGRTPRGRFSVYRKETLSWSAPFRTWMPYANYFYGGFAMHGYADVPSYPASHGCVRVPLVEAPVVYGFTAYGTPVWIR